ncbi:MAG TPA: hypothetical protein VKO18_19785 [Terriglobia bacterium]|nr:hypothetical protein [Terriglobia bacterium]
MYCPNCGGTIHAGQYFCNRCGLATTPTTSATPTPPATSPSPALNATAPVAATVGAAQYSCNPQPSRVAKHLQILGIIWIVVSFLRLIPAVAMVFFGHMGFPFMAMPMRRFLMPILGAVGAYLAITAVVGILVGWGLIDRRPWARILAIVVGCLKLIDFPFGTALGIYTLFVLASPGGEEEYQRMARVS